MPEMTESQRRWEAWYDAYLRVSRALPGEIDERCPDGDGGRLHVSYTGSPVNRIGFVTMWCDAAWDALFLGRVGIPEGVEMLPFDATPEEREAAVPDVTLIPLDPYTPDEE